MEKHRPARKKQRLVSAGTAIVAVSVSCFMFSMWSRGRPMDRLPGDFTPPPNWRLIVSRARRGDEWRFEGPTHYARFESPLKPTSVLLQLNDCFTRVDGLSLHGWYRESRPIRKKDMDLEGYPEWICRYLLHRRPIKGAIYVWFRNFGGNRALYCYVWPNGSKSAVEVIYDSSMP